MSRFSTLGRKSAQLAAIGITGLILGLSGCGSDGSDGAQGPAGATGPTGPTGPAGPPGTGTPTSFDYNIPSDVAALVADGNRLLAEITSATIASPPVVTFTLADAYGRPIRGFSAGNTRYSLGKLLPNSGNEFGGWRSYINSLATSADGALPQALQATTETGSADRFVDNGDGSYTYTFATDPANVTSPVAVAYEPGLTHRIAIQFGGIDNSIMPFNPSIDFVPNGGAGSGHRSIVSIDTCNGCHDNLALHGGGRNNTTYCDACHNDFTRDPDTGALVDLAHLAHAIHGAGFRMQQAATDTCTANGGIVGGSAPNFRCTVDGTSGGAPVDFDPMAYAYVVVGYRDSVHDYGDVGYPNDITDCATCHTASEATPDGDMWKTNISAEACGACHVGKLVVDPADPVTGLSTYGISHDFGGGEVIARNDACSTCHNDTTAPTAATAHAQKGSHYSIELGKNYKAEIVNVAIDPDTRVVTADVKVTNLTTGANDLFADAEYTGGRIRVWLSWSADDFYGWGDETGFADGTAGYVQLSSIAVPPAQNADGSFSIVLRDLPAAMTGDPMVSMDARMSVGGVNAYADSVAYFTGKTRTMLVDEAKCNKCHGTINNHGGRGTNNLLVCLNCHNNDWASGDATATTPTSPLTMSVMIHELHSADPEYLDGAVAHVTFPGNMAKCQTCHKAGAYNVARPTARAITTNLGVDPALWTDDVADSPTAGVCSQCHDDLASRNHMMQNGGMFGAQKDTFTANGVDGIPDVVQESCAVCHGPGSIADTAAMHQ
jgi:OmcA/MtrC family decaheme c-type cytochrome